MRSASTPARDQIIADLLKGSRISTFVSVDWDDDGIWKQIEDLDEDAGVSFNSPVDRSEYGRIVMTPMAGEVNFKVVNDSGKYCDGSGTRFEGILSLNRKIRVLGGYLIPGTESTEAEIDVMDGTPENGVRVLGGKLFRKMDYTISQSPVYFSDLYGPTYGSALYGSARYGINGAWVGTFDSGASHMLFQSVRVTANSANWDVWARAVPDVAVDAEMTDSGSWKYLGETVNGEATFDIGRRGKIIEIGITSKTGDWSTDDYISGVAVSMVDNIEWIYKSVFYLDQPAFPEPPAPEIPRVQCRGRDAWRLALETDVNIGDATGKTLDEVIKEICDSCGIKYTASSIASLSAFPTRILTTGFEKPIKASTAIDHCMKCTVRDDLPTYRLAMLYDEALRDNVLYLKERSNEYDAIFVLQSRYYLEIGDRSKNSDRQVARVTINDTDPGTEEEIELATQTITTTGTKNFDWSGSGIATNKRVSVPDVAWTNGLKCQVVASSTTAMGINIQTMPTSGSFEMKVFGCLYKTAPPTASGEYLRLGAGGKNEGQTYRFTNPLVVNYAEADHMAKGFIAQMGDPVATISGLKYPYPNFVIDPGDRVLVWSRFLFDDHIYRVMNVSHDWDSNGGQTSYTLEDTGLRFSDISDFEWDEGVLQWDNGAVWDMARGPMENSDPVDYSYLRKVRFSNVG